MKELSKSYSPKDFEASRYQTWEQDGCFLPKPSKTGSKFYIPIPPPNVTGNLHVGHSLMLTIQDIMIRYHRMKGDETLWVPGTDHAGISTQARVEAKLAKSGINRRDLGRAKFLEEVWKWKDEYAANINDQFRKMGSSVDWTKERFTLDEGLSKSVEHVFVDLYKKGLIYRGEYMVNYSPKLESVISDAEVDYKEEKSKMYYIHYFVSGSDNELVVATTRPETLFGDLAIVVHPKDKRYKKMIGRMAVLPIVNREIPIIADDTVDREFGTGAVKVTPAHDPADFALAKKHGLRTDYMVMDKNGIMNAEAGIFAGQDALTARENIVELLKARGNLIKVEPYIQKIAYCSRGGCRIQSIVSTQWFVDSVKMAEPVMKGYKKGEFSIIPNRYGKVFEDWMEHLHDWCISRQLWWGHQIPAYYKKSTGELLEVTKDPSELYEKYGKDEVVRDEDVLDTWFSSALWPFSILDWDPENPSELFKKFYPADVLETGHDILLFWVIRMLLMGYHFTGQTPFKTIYLNGLVLDEQGRKMSKSLDNVLNPIEVIDQYGTDALRMALSLGNTPGNNLNFSLKLVENNTLFLNKLWNIARFVQGKIGEGEWGNDDFLSEIDPQKLLTHEKAFLSRLSQTITLMSEGMESFNFSDPGLSLIQFIREEFADFYLETTKIGEFSSQQKAILAYSLRTILALFHPYAPFITDELAEKVLGIPHLSLLDWPKPIFQKDGSAEKEISRLRELISTIRNIRSERGVKPGEVVEIFFRGTPSAHRFLESNQELLCSLAKLQSVQFVTQPIASQDYSYGVSQDVDFYINTTSGVNVEQEIIRLRSQIDEKKNFIRILDEKLLNKDFLKNAPEALVRSQQERKHQTEDQLKKLQEKLSQFEEKQKSE